MDTITPTQLADFPGAPFTATIIGSAQARLERVLGWHVSPSKTETIKATGARGDDRDRLILPSRRITSVTEVRDSGGTIVPTWSLTGETEAILTGCYWNPGEIYEVDVVHGYETLPADLLPELAGMCSSILRDPTVASESAGPFSVTLRNQLLAGSSTLRAYSIYPGV